MKAASVRHLQPVDPEGGEPMTAEEWADRLRDCQRDKAAAAVRYGRTLLDAKEALEHGEWLKCLELAGVAYRTAQRYMQIADHPAIANAPRVALLPTSVRALSYLSRQPAEKVEQLLDDGLVGAETTETQIRALLNPDLGGADNIRAKRPPRDYTKRLAALGERIRQFSDDLTRENLDIYLTVDTEARQEAIRPLGALINNAAYMVLVLGDHEIDPHQYILSDTEGIAQ